MTPRTIIAVVGSMASAACAPAFDDRHDLLGFRIAAVGVVDGQASASVWSGELFHAEPTRMRWTADGEFLGEGWEIPVPAEARELGLTATAPDGRERSARVSVGDALEPLAYTRSSVAVGKDVSIEARGKLVEEPLDGAASPGLAVRIRLDSPDGNQTRWMVADGATTLLELDPETVDVMPERVQFDDGEVSEREAIDPGVVHVLALRMDGSGGNRWAWIDAGLGTDRPLFRSEGWLLEGDVDTSTGLLAVTLDELSPSGVGTLGAPEPVADLTQNDPPACAPPGQPFSLDWLADGRCSVSGSRGRRVVLAVD